MIAGAPLLSIHDLAVEYGRGRRRFLAVQDVSFDVGAGETLGLVGESGSGKSTIAQAVLGLVPIASGSVTFRGADVTHANFADRRKMYRQLQIVFQDPYASLNPQRTVSQTLAEPLQAFGERDGAARSARVNEMLQRMGLPADAGMRYPADFSGGQRQRIAIARALMLAPQLIICDEAVSALDLTVQAQILNLLGDLQAESGLSYLFISHDLDVVRHMCDRIVVLHRGRVVESGPTDEVVTAPAHQYTESLLDAAPQDPRWQRPATPRPLGSLPEKTST